MMDEKILRELKEMNKTQSSIRTFIIAQTQLIKTVTLEIQKINREILAMKFKRGGRWHRLVAWILGK
ncbi:hypothetical protein KA005_68705 [bacterium]|nr:hypothetical protein [bacterium]